MRTKKRRWSTWIVIAVIVAGAAFFVIRGRGKTAEPEIRTAKVTRGPVTASVSGNGTLEAATTVEVKSNVGGQVVELAVDEGDRVHAGQVIARIDPSDSVTNFQQAQADLTGAEAKVTQAITSKSMTAEQTAASITAAQESVEAAKQRLLQAEQQATVQPTLTKASINQAQSNLNAAHSSLTQTKEALIPQKISTAQASYDQAKASYDQAQSQLTRQQALLAKGFVPKSQVESAEQQYATAKAQQESAASKLATVKAETDEDLRSAEAKVDQAEAALQTAKANSVQDAVKAQDVAAARAALKQAEANLVSTKTGNYQASIKRDDIIQAQAQTERSKAAVKNARTQLDYTTIIAPSDGVVVKKYVETGSIVTAGRSSSLGSGAGVTIVDIADTTHMTVTVNVDETDIAQIAVGQSVDITVDAYPNDLFFGTVKKIAPEATADQNVTSVPVTVDITISDSKLKPGMNATCDFVTAHKDNVLLVPNEAVKEGNDGMTVTVLDHGKQVVRPVKIGLEGDDQTEIESGLHEGDTVVTAVIQPTSTTTTTSSSSSNKRRGGPGPF